MIKKHLERFGEFYRQKVLPIRDKVMHRLTHNPIIRSTHTDILFFGKLRIAITNRRRESVVGIMFIMLWIVGYLVFALYPVFNTLYLSFHNVFFDVGGALRLEFVGIGNYQAAFLQDPYFVEILLSYTLELILNVPVTIVFALIIAMLINQNVALRGLWRTVFFLPVIIASGPVIAELMNQGATTLPSISDYTFIDLVINNIGTFLANPLQALFEQILLVLWFAGIQILILLAGLQKIDKSIYEAAQIDGASPWETFWKITLPSLMPLIVVSIIYTVVSMSVFSLNNVVIYIRDRMLGQATADLTTGYGYSATLAWVYFLVMAIIIGIFVGIVSLKGRLK